MSKPKRHHFVPESYLEAFTNNKGFLHVLPKDKGRGQFESSVSNVAVIKHYYTFTNDEGEFDLKIENALSDIESAAKPILRHIEARDDISEEGKFILSLYVGLMACRNPNYRKSVEDFLEHTGGIVKDRVFETNHDLIDSAPDVLVEAAGGKENLVEWLKDNTKIKPTKEASLQFVHFGVDIARQLNKMHWRFWINDDENCPFLTSDNPSYVCSSYSGETAYGVGIALAHARLHFPVSPKVCLVADWIGQGVEYKKANKQQIIRINSRAIRHADKEIYSPVINEKVMHLFENNRKYEFTTLIDQMGPYNLVRRKLVKKSHEASKE